MKAVHKFKNLVAHKRPSLMESIFGQEGSSRFVQPPLSMHRPHPTASGVSARPYLSHKSHSDDRFDRRPFEQTLVTEGVHRAIDVSNMGFNLPSTNHPSPVSALKSPESEARLRGISDPPKSNSQDSYDRKPQLHRDVQADPSTHRSPSNSAKSPTSTTPFNPYSPSQSPPPNSLMHSHTFSEGTRGHAHDPLQDHLFLNIGPSAFSGHSTSDSKDFFPHYPDDDDEDDAVPVVSESPGAADLDIYETAYRDEIEKIRSKTMDKRKAAEEEGRQQSLPTVYLTRRVDEVHKKWDDLGELTGRLIGLREWSGDSDKSSGSRQHQHHLHHGWKNAEKSEKQADGDDSQTIKKEDKTSAEEQGDSLDDKKEQDGGDRKKMSPLMVAGPALRSQTSAIEKGQDMAEKSKASFMGLLGKMREQRKRKSVDDQGVEGGGGI